VLWITAVLDDWTSVNKSHVLAGGLEVDRPDQRVGILTNKLGEGTVKGLG